MHGLEPVLCSATDTVKDNGPIVSYRTASGGSGSLSRRKKKNHIHTHIYISPRSTRAGILICGRSKHATTGIAEAHDLPSRAALAGRALSPSHCQQVLNYSNSFVDPQQGPRPKARLCADLGALRLTQVLRGAACLAARHAFAMIIFMCCLVQWLTIS